MARVLGTPTETATEPRLPPVAIANNPDHSSLVPVTAPQEQAAIPKPAVPEASLTPQQRQMNEMAGWLNINVQAELKAFQNNMAQLKPEALNAFHNTLQPHVDPKTGTISAANQATAIKNAKQAAMATIKGSILQAKTAANIDTALGARAPAPPTPKAPTNSAKADAAPNGPNAPAPGRGAEPYPPQQDHVVTTRMSNNNETGVQITKTSADGSRHALIMPDPKQGGPKAARYSHQRRDMALKTKHSDLLAASDKPKPEKSPTFAGTRGDPVLGPRAGIRPAMPTV